MLLDLDSLKELDWWHQEIRIWASKSLTVPPPTMILTTDASLTGWGAVLEGIKTASGFFPPETQMRSANYRELFAVLMAINTFSKEICNQSLLLRTDNITTMMYLNGQGGTHKPLNQTTKAIFWTLKHLNCRLTALHLPGEDNNLADSLSRLNPMTEWQLNPAAFKVIDNKWGPHSVDRFASHHNHLLPRYNSRFHDPKAEATDALLQDWTK